MILVSGHGEELSLGEDKRGEALLIGRGLVVITIEAYYVETRLVTMHRVEDYLHKQCH